MLRTILPVVIALLTVLAAWDLAPQTAQQAQAGVLVHRRAAPDLFYNFYVPPGGCAGVPAQLYVSPRPTPPLVGHTYVTYQPLMPHEFLYKHYRVYHRCTPGAGRTKTVVIWR